MTRKGATLSAMALIALLAVVAIGAMSASAATNRAKHHSASKQLVGSWIVDVNRGPVLPPLKSLQTFTRGHGVVEIANGGTLVRSPSHGAWKRIGSQLYSYTLIFFRYDRPTGDYIGTQKIRSTLRLAPDGDTFTAVAISELRDPAGNIVASGLRATAAGERIKVERIPDLP